MKKISYQKKALSVSEQIDLLRSRGIKFSDVETAKKFLKYNNYYFISGYIYYFEKKGEKRTHILNRPVDFSEIIDLIKFDNLLRLHFFKAISIIEISLRAVMARELSLIQDPFCLTESNIYDNTDFIGKIDKEIKNSLQLRNKEPFIKHYKQKYIEEVPPLWISIEIITFGTLSKIYKNLKKRFQKKISFNFGIHPYIFESWLRALTELRNVCAHHARFWNRIFVNSPKLPSKTPNFLKVLLSYFPDNIPENQSKKLGVFLPVLTYLLDTIDSDNRWSNNLTKVIENCSIIKSYDLGLNNWWW